MYIELCGLYMEKKWDKLDRFILFILGAAAITPASFICIVSLFVHFHLPFIGLIVWLVCLVYSLIAWYIFLKILP